MDENRLSRQIIAIGLDAMKKLLSSSAVVVGLGGVGVEIAKNIILANIHNVILVDTTETSMSDLSAQFYLSDKDIGKNRAVQSFDSLLKLNPNVSLSVSTEKFDSKFVDELKEGSTVIITEMIPNIVELSNYMHQKGIRHIIAAANGVFGFVFTDCIDFVSMDAIGEPAKEFLVMDISSEEKALVQTLPDGIIMIRHGMSDGDTVVFSEVEGMEEINGREFKVEVVNPFAIRIGDTRGFKQYINSGVCRQVIKPTHFTGLPLAEAMKEGKIAYFDFVNEGAIALAFIASSYAENNVESLMKEAERLSKELGLPVDEKIISEFARTRNCVLSPVASILGGFAGQEAMKLMTDKFTPLEQCLPFHFLSALPEKIEYTVHNDRYDPYRQVFGDALEEKMQSLSYFMIGAGALGCEYLKILAMMGVSTKDNAMLTVTDTIEKSNLSRQFLFRSENIGEMKSSAAVAAVQKMNPQFHAVAHQNMVANSTLNIYNTEFYNGIDGVLNALDNMQARIFSDGMCCFYNKPMIDAGTEGVKANVQVVVPHVTTNYGSSQDAEPGGAALCSIHAIPHNFAHCAAFAGTIFDEHFKAPAEGLLSIYNGTIGNEQEMQIQDTIKLAYFAFKNTPKNFADCVAIAAYIFHKEFQVKMEGIIGGRPRDHPDWNSKHRYPDVPTFNPEDPLHSEFLESASFIIAEIFGIAEKGKAIDLWKEAFERSATIQEIPYHDGMVNEIKSAEKLKVTPMNFDKDSETLMHAEFVHAAANIKAHIFRLEEKSKLETIRIIGSIIPALATTTALICGFATMELYKLHALEKKPIEAFSNTYVNLGANVFSISEPVPAERYTIPTTGEEFTIYNHISFDYRISFEELFAKLQERAKSELLSITIDCWIIKKPPVISIEEYLKNKMPEVLKNDRIEIVPFFLDIDDEKAFPRVFLNLK